MTQYGRERSLTLIIALLLCLLGSACSEASQVAHDEFGPKALLAKYQWFKDASAALDKKVAEIQVYDNRLKTLEKGYVNSPRSRWAREDREQYNIWLSEAAGITASYNQLAAEYNSQMAKFNWQFANTGQLPAGASTPLPREYKPYMTK